MKMLHEVAYPAPPDIVYAMLTDPAFREKVGAAQEMVSQEVTATPRGDGVTLVLDQVANTAGLPAIARKIAGETTRAVVTERWDGPEGGTIEIVAPGKPTRATGTIVVNGTDEGSSHVLDLDVVVKVPLVAGKLEKIMADDIRRGLDIEHGVGLAWLKGDR